jgi:hypothetical protein
LFHGPVAEEGVFYIHQNTINKNFSHRLPGDVFLHSLAQTSCSNFHFWKLRCNFGENTVVDVNMLGDGVVKTSILQINILFCFIRLIFGIITIV